MLQFGADRVTLNILHASLKLLTVNLDHQNDVLVANSQGGRVAGKDHVLRLFAIAVDNGGDITNSADAACIALTEIGAGLGSNFNFRHGNLHSLMMGDAPRE